MPLISIDAIAPQCHLGLWRIEDTIDDIIATDNRLAGVVDKIEHFHSESRRKEVLAVYGLLFAMTDNPCLRIEHDDLSRPVIDGYHVSISHTRGYAALLLSTRHKVAIDIEFISNRVERVASKFNRNDEVTLSMRNSSIGAQRKRFISYLLTKIWTSLICESPHLNSGKKGISR